VWRSWLAHLHGVQGVVRSSRITPTIVNQGVIKTIAPLFFTNVQTICKRILYSEMQMLIKKEGRLSFNESLASLS